MPCPLTFPLLESNLMMKYRERNGPDKDRLLNIGVCMYVCIELFSILQLACKTIRLASQEMILSATRSPMTLLNLSRC